MNLFELKDNIVVFAPQALALKPFKALWTRDKTKDKVKAIAELSFVYYFCDYRSDFSDIVDEATRFQQVVDLLDLGKAWKVDPKVRDCIELYGKLQNSIAIQTLNAAKVAVDKVNKFLLSVNLDDVDKSGRPIYRPKDIDDSVGKIHVRLTQLSKVEEEVKKQIEAKVDNQGTMAPGMFEDGIPD